MTQPLLDTATLADLYAIDNSAMPETVTITAVTLVDDGGGAQTETTTTTTSPGRLVAATGREAEGDQLRERGDYRLYLPRAAVISGTSRVTIGGKVYRVVWTPTLTAYSSSRVIGLTEA
jgi:hypothetical protein